MEFGDDFFELVISDECHRKYFNSEIGNKKFNFAVHKKSQYAYEPEKIANNILLGTGNGKGYKSSA